jgi:hypothetical protein
MFGPELSVHVWFLRKSTDTAATILNKYHGHSTPENKTTYTHFEITVLSNGILETSVDHLSDNSDYKSVQSGTAN